MLQAALTTVEVPLDQIKYQMTKLHEKLRYRYPVQIVPANVKRRPSALFHSVDVEPGIYLTDREATEEEIRRM
jgi:hypothetical protein